MGHTMAMLVSFPGHLQGGKQSGNEATHSSPIRELPNKLLVTCLSLSYKWEVSSHSGGAVCGSVTKLDLHVL